MKDGVFMTLKVPPKAATRPRFRCYSGFKSPRAYSDPNYRRWLNAAIEEIRGQWRHDGMRFTGPVSVYAVHAVERPGRTRKDFPVPDVDNYAKALLDALTQSKVVWDDDSQVVSLVTRKTWTDVPGGAVVVHISPVSPEDYEEVKQDEQQG